MDLQLHISNVPKRTETRNEVVIQKRERRKQKYTRFKHQRKNSNFGAPRRSHGGSVEERTPGLFGNKAISEGESAKVQGSADAPPEIQNANKNKVPYLQKKPIQKEKNKPKMAQAPAVIKENAGLGKTASAKPAEKNGEVNVLSFEEASSNKNQSNFNINALVRNTRKQDFDENEPKLNRERRNKKESKFKRGAPAKENYVENPSKEMKGTQFNKKKSAMEIEEANKNEDEQGPVSKGNIDIEKYFAIDDKEELAIDKSVFTTKVFEDLNLNPRLLSGLQSCNYTKMTKIQSLSFEHIKNESNCVIKSQTGSGKTLAYLVPIIEMLSSRDPQVDRSQGTIALIICPTRELCVQILEVTQKLLKNLIWIVPGALMGGENLQHEKSRLRRGLNILISTPSRLVYHMKNTNSLHFECLKFLIFEESDRTLDMGFKRELDYILEFLGSKIDFKNLSKILISATFSSKIEGLCLKMQDENLKYIGFGKDDSEDQMKEGNQSFEIDEIFKIPKTLEQHYVLTEEIEKVALLMSLLMMLRNSKIIMFVATIDEVEYFYTLCEQLKYTDMETNQKGEKLISQEVYKLHGNIEQKNRTSTYFDFKNTKNGALLISTDVASRGLDFYCVTHSILFDVPESVVDYCNRIGRTARINRKGFSFLFLFKQEKEFIDSLAKKDIVLKELDKQSCLSFVRQELLSKHRIRENPYQYIKFLINGLVKESREVYISARRAYISYMRAYKRLPDKMIFNLKALNLQFLAKSFGLEKVKYNDTRSGEYQENIVVRNKDKIFDANEMRRHDIQNRSRKSYIRSVDQKKMQNMEFI